MNWETIYVFISSTFNDMHAERDLLVKQVFPELRMWCAKRKIKLVDVDLRWGVSAADALENKRVVDVCMKNIDKCRPFFLCFLGQRRGWIPNSEDVNPDTFESFPELHNYLGKTSVTELEILHALIHPLADGAKPVEHARFYFRDKNYLRHIKTDAHKELFCPRKGFFSGLDSDFEHFKKNLRKKYPIVDYTTTWNPTKPSPELSGELSVGRLENFRAGDTTLGDDVLIWLKNEIAEAYPEHMEVIASDSPLMLELSSQDIQLFQASDGYISRPFEEKILLDLMDEDSDTPILLRADAGCGKTSLLAHMIDTQKEKKKLYYRFVGTTPKSFTSGDLALSLVQQWIHDGLLPEDEGQHTPDEVTMLFPNLLIKAGQKEPFLLILDGMDQLLDGIKENFLPINLPQGCSLIFSLRADAEYVPHKDIRIHSLGLMNDRDDKIQMVKGYLNTFLKDVDDAQLEQIISMKGADNPLYMKIVLNELRQHGSFDTLFEMLNKNYGTTPLEAFCQVLERIRKQLSDQGVPEHFFYIFFGCLACTTDGLDGDLFYRASRRLNNDELLALTQEQVCDMVYALARELEPFFVLDGNKILYRYDSFRRAFLALAPYYIDTCHSMLSTAFAERAMVDDYPPYMEHALYHITNAEENFIPAYFEHVYCILWIIRHNGAKLLADTFHTIAFKRRLSDFENPARAISMANTRLDTYPETLFMELHRYGDQNNPIVKTILEREADYKEHKHFIPLGDPGATALIYDEYLLSNQHISAVKYDAPYYVIYLDDEIRIVDSRTSELVNILYTEKKNDIYDHYRITVGEQLLYITYWNKEGLRAWKCYSLPELSLISQCESPKTSPIYPDKLTVVDGELYVLCTNKNNSIHVLVCINTGETLYSTDFGDKNEATLLGEYLTLYNKNTGKWCIIRVKDGKVLIEDTFLGYENVPRIDKYAGGANLRAGLGKSLCIWLTGVDVVNGKSTSAHEYRNYRILDNGDLELIASSKERFVSISSVSVLSDGHIIVECNGFICILDEMLHVLGYYDLQDTVYSTEEWSGRFALMEDDTLLIFRSKMIQKLSFSRLLASLDKEIPEISHVKCDAAVKDGWLYVFGPKLSRTNFETCEKQICPGEPGIVERICPWNIRDKDDYSCVSTAYNGRNYTTYDLSMVVAPNRCTVSEPNKYILLHAFCYRDRNNKIINCNVVADRTPCKHFYKGKEETFFHCHLHVFSYNGSLFLMKWDKYDLDIDILGDALYKMRVESLCYDNDAFIVIPNVYKNEDEIELRVYRASTRESIMEHTCPVPLGETLPQRMVYGYDKGFVLTYDEGNNYFFADLDLEGMRFHTGTVNHHLMEGVTRDGYLYFHTPFSMKITIYSLAEHKFVKSFSLVNRNGLFGARHIVRINDYLIVQFFDSDVLEVYSFETGEKLFEQRMEHVMDNLYLDPKSKHIAMLDGNQRTYFWKLSE